MRRLPVPCFDLDRRNGLVCLDVACVVELDAWSVLGAHSSGKHGPPLSRLCPGRLKITASVAYFYDILVLMSILLDQLRLKGGAEEKASISHIDVADVCSIISARVQSYRLMTYP